MAEEVLSSSCEILGDGLSMSASAEMSASSSQSLEGSSTTTPRHGPPRGPGDASRVTHDDFRNIPPR